VRQIEKKTLNGQNYKQKLAFYAKLFSIYPNLNLLCYLKFYGIYNFFFNSVTTAATTILLSRKTTTKHQQQQ